MHGEFVLEMVEDLWGERERELYVHCTCFSLNTKLEFGGPILTLFGLQGTSELYICPCGLLGKGSRSLMLFVDQMKLIAFGRKRAWTSPGRHAAPAAKRWRGRRR